jgi:hypothetical protein
MLALSIEHIRILRDCGRRRKLEGEPILSSSLEGESPRVELRIKVLQYKHGT